MSDRVTITGVEVHEFQYELQDHGYDYNGLFAIYKKGSSIKRRDLALKIHTSAGITGEYIGGRTAGVGQIQTIGNRGKFQLVMQIDAGHDGVEFVEIVRAFLENDQAQVDFGPGLYGNGI